MSDQLTISAICSALAMAAFAIVSPAAIDAGGVSFAASPISAATGPDDMSSPGLNFPSVPFTD